MSIHDKVMVEDIIEEAYWRFDARRKGYGVYKGQPEAERDAFKAEMRLIVRKDLNRLNPLQRFWHKLFNFI